MTTPENEGRKDTPDTMVGTVPVPGDGPALPDAKRNPSIATRERRGTAYTPSGETPYRVVKGGKVSDEIVYLDAAQEAQFTIAQASEPVDPKTSKFASWRAWSYSWANVILSAPLTAPLRDTT